MKKILLFAFMLTMGMAAKAADCQDGPYGLQINGSTVVDAPKFGDPDAQGRVQYKAGCVALKSGDVIQLINQSCGATWMVNLDPYGEYENFDGGKDANKLTCKKDGNYDFYIKLSATEGDLVYVGPGENCGGGGVTPGGGGSGDGNPRFMWKAELDGDWIEPSLTTMFVDGHSTISFYNTAYLFLIYQVDGSAGVEYMCDSYTSDTHACFRQGGGEKWGVPAGTTDLYIYDNEDGTVEVSNQVMPGKKPWAPNGQQGVENIKAQQKARKMIIDGQLRIIRGDKMFDITGAEL